MACKFHQEDGYMVCEHGKLRIPITEPSFTPEQYHGSCQRDPNAPPPPEPKSYLLDTIIRDGHPVEVSLTRPPCIHMGEKRLYRDGSPVMAKAQGCKNTPENVRPIIFAPVYKCSKYRRCTPFAREIEDDSDPTRSCYGCGCYKRPLAKIEPIIHDDSGSDATLV